MASNPMQRKAQNAFLLGMFLTMILAAIIIGGLLWKINQDKKAEEVIENSKVQVYVLSKDATAGTNVAKEDDKKNLLAGDGLVLKEIQSDLVPATAIKVTDFNIKEADKRVITKDTLYKIDLKAGTVLTKEMLVEADDVTQDDTREQEFNMIILPTYLEKNEYIDIRLRLPSGEDFIVVSKKKVLDADEVTMWINLTEDEILTISNAIVEAYQILGSELYATTYVEPGLQEQATVTYIPSVSVTRLINSDPNVVDEAKRGLAERYSTGSLAANRTEIINPALDAGAEDAQTNVSTGVTTSIETQKESRNEYIKELEAQQQQAAAAAASAATGATAGAATTTVK